MRLHPPNKALYHELVGEYKRVRVAIYRKGDAFVAIKLAGTKKLMGPCWVTVHRGPNDEMRELAARLADVIDSYSRSAGIKQQVEVEA